MPTAVCRHRPRQIGALRQVVPESLTFCWTLVRDYEDIPDAELELEFVTA